MSEILKKSLNEKIKICEKLFNLRLDKEHLNKYSLQEIKKIIDNSSFIGKKWYFEKAAELEIISK
jgi:hypothetical protein